MFRTCRDVSAETLLKAQYLYRLNVYNNNYLELWKY